MKTALKILITLDLCFFVAGIIMHAMESAVRNSDWIGDTVPFVHHYAVFHILPLAYARTEHSLIFFLFTLRFWI